MTIWKENVVNYNKNLLVATVESTDNDLIKKKFVLLNII